VSTLYIFVGYIGIDGLEVCAFNLLERVGLVALCDALFLQDKVINCGDALSLFCNGDAA